MREVFMIKLIRYIFQKNHTIFFVWGLGYSRLLVERLELPT